jgi:hypothetical protein
MNQIPWIGLAALLAMFLIPFLPDRLFEGPRVIRHWPRKHVCARCNALWSEGHMCVMEPGDSTQVLPAELLRVQPGTALKRQEDLDNAS